MIGSAKKYITSAAAAATLILAGAGGASAAVCVGDCNGDGEVLINEVVSSVNIFLESAVVATCLNADQNGDGVVLINEVVGAVNSFLDALTCPMVTPSGPTATPTSPPPTNTPTRTHTPTPSPTATVGEALCGDGAVQGGADPEECDDGGICIGGDNAGTACTSESDCVGQGVCNEGIKIGTACDTNADCPGAKCIHCKTFGGDGCAANCTFETNISYDLVAGQKTKLCLGGANNDQPCTSNANCPQGLCADQVAPGTTGSFVHDGFLQLALPLSGSQTFTLGKLRQGRITGVIKANNSSLDRVPVSALACACVRSVPAKSCGGTLFEKDGTGSTGCSDAFTPGESECEGKKPCAFVHGPGNSSSGIIGCGADGLTGVDLLGSQVSNGQLIYRNCVGGANDGNACSVAADCPGGACSTTPAGTAPAGSGPAMITLSGSGPMGSAILLNSSAIGTTTGICTCTAGCLTFEKVCAGGANAGNACTTDANCPGSKCGKPNPAYGPDLEFCTTDDPQSSRGTPQTLPQVTGVATGIIRNTRQSTQTHYCDKDRTKTCTSDANCGADGPCTFEIGPFSYTGKPYDCSKLTANPPSNEGGTVAGAFTSLNQPATGDIVVRNVFVAGPPK